MIRMVPRGRLPLITFVLVMASLPAAARDFRVGQVPNGGVWGCSTCHTDPNGGSGRNTFGRQIHRGFLQDGNVEWNPLLASRDSDGDGLSNGAELQDRYGHWVIGQPPPGDAALVTQPGEISSFPGETLSVVFANMTAYLGQRLELRVVDKSDGREAGRASVPSILQVMHLELEVLEAGQSYWVDFFIDANGNGRYDPPPADPAWRLQADKITGTTNLLFNPADTTIMTDIGWVYRLTLRLSGLGDYLARLLEWRLIDRRALNEVNRGRVEFVSEPEFEITMAGLAQGHDYHLDLYADVNDNRFYQAPPADHAWRLDLPGVDGDETIAFSPDAPQSDIGWKYRFTLNCTGMFPNLGRLFEFRVTDLTLDAEAGRARVDRIPADSFTRTLPGIRPGARYRLDLYADTNGNGIYNAPPIDSAWRFDFKEFTGDVVWSFISGSPFTDIQWPPLTAIYFPRFNYEPGQWTEGFGGLYQGPYDALFRLTAYSQYAQVIGSTGFMTWPSGTQRAEQVESLFGLTGDARGWALLETNQPLVRSFFLTQYFHEGLAGLDGAGTFSAPIRTGILPRIKMLGSYTTHLSLGNPAERVTMVHVTGYDGTQSHFGGSFLLAPRSVSQIDLTLLFSTDFDGYVEIASEGLIMANAVIQDGDASIASVNLLSPEEAGTTLYAPHVVRHPDVYYSELNLVNPAATPVTATLTVYRADGSVLADPFQVELPARQVVVLRNQYLGLPAGVVSEGWLKVEAPSPIQGCLTFGQPEDNRYMSTLPLQRLPLQELYFTQVANGHVGGVDFFTGLAVVNPFDSDIAVTIRVFGSDGLLLGEVERPLGPREKYVRLLQFIEGIGDLPDQSSGYIQVTATGPVLAFALFGDEPLNFLSAVPAQP